MKKAKPIVAAMMLCAALTAPAVGSDYYKVRVWRESQDLYRVVGTGFYIKTRFCYQFAFGEEAILRVDSSFGYTVGELVFKGGGGRCDVEKIIG